MTDAAHMNAFPRALTELLAAAAFTAPRAAAVAPERLFHAHRPVRASFLEHHEHQDAADVGSLDADSFYDLESPRSRADSSDGESSTTSNSSVSSRHKCSLAFILSSSDDGASDTSADCDYNQSAVSVPMRQLKSFASMAPRRIVIPDRSASPSVSNTATPSSSPSSSAMAAAALNSYTPTSEYAKVKRRRVAPSSKVTKSCKLKTSSGAGRGRDATAATVAASSTVTATVTASATATTATSAAPVKKGSKYCIVEGCGSRAKHARRCWKHGGSVKCKVADCANRAKTKGVCWSHGGGTICSFTNCGTISVSNGVCWAHGGGKRCAIEGCARPAYERTQNLCSLHFDDKNKIVSGAAAAAAKASKPKTGRTASR